MRIMDFLKNGAREVRNRQPYIISPVFSVPTVNYGSSVFFSIDEKNSVRNLQYGPKTRLIRGIYIVYQIKMIIIFGSDINNSLAKEEMTTGERYCLILLIY